MDNGLTKKVVFHSFLQKVVFLSLKIVNNGLSLVEIEQIFHRYEWCFLPVFVRRTEHLLWKYRLQNASQPLRQHFLSNYCFYIDLATDWNTHLLLTIYLNKPFLSAMPLKVCLFYSPFLNS